MASASAPNSAIRDLSRDASPAKTASRRATWAVYLDCSQASGKRKKRVELRTFYRVTQKQINTRAKKYIIFRMLDHAKYKIMHIVQV